MAIVKMNKISIVGLEENKEEMLRVLMQKGFVQIDDSSQLAQEELSGIVDRDTRQNRVMEIEQEIAAVGAAIDTLSHAVQVKAPMFAPKPAFCPLDKTKSETLFTAAQDINAISRRISTIKAKENVLENNAELLRPWLKFDVALDEMKTKCSVMFLGTFPANGDKNEVQAALEHKELQSSVGVVDQDKQLVYSYVVSHKACAEETVQVLREFGFNPVSFPEETGTPMQAVRAYEEKKKDLQVQRDTCTESLRAYAPQMEELKNLYDSLCVKRDENQIVERLVKTKTSFCLNGWLPAKKAHALEQEFSQRYACYIETKPADAQEEFPVLLQNNALVTPFEDITNMYSVPSPRDVDPSAIMAFFYIIFFGMMLADAGYGLLIAIACFVIVKKAKMGKGEGNLIKLMGICGISTAVWGLIFGGFLGMEMPGVINPLEDVMLLMGMSLVFGIVHIYIGLGIKGYTLLRDKEYMSFFSDIILWYLFITGVCILVIPIIAGDIGVIADIGKYLAIIGALGIVLTGGRVQKSVPMKLFKGVSALYGITGYFGDILSYTRLMALCLSSGVIAQVINLLGAMAGPVGIVIIGLIGHSINLFIGALGAYVHTSRLQFVEFFGKFYEGGGTAFSPFRFRTKYTTINDEEM